MGSTKLCIAYADDVSRPSGGTERVSALIEGLLNRGIEVSLVSLRLQHDPPDFLSNVNFIPVSTGDPTRLPLPFTQPERAIRVLQRAKQRVNRTGADLQIEHSTLAGVASLLQITDYTVDMHDLCFASPVYDQVPLSPLVKRTVAAIEQRGLRDASSIIVVSETMKNYISESWGLPHDQITVIPNAYRQDAVANVDRSTWIHNRITFFGTLHPKVNVEAIAEIAALSTVDEMVVIGDGEQYSELAKLRERRQLNSLHLTGYLSNERAFNLLAESALAINPQYHSPEQYASCPIKFYYYAALGLPILASAGPDSAADLAEAGAAKLVPRDRSFADHVVSLLEDQSELKEMRTRTVKWAEDNTWNQRVNALLELHSEPTPYAPTS